MSPLEQRLADLGLDPDGLLDWVARRAGDAERTCWRLRLADRALRVTVASTCPATVLAIEDAARRHGLELERVEPAAVLASGELELELGADDVTGIITRDVRAQIVGGRLDGLDLQVADAQIKP